MMMELVYLVGLFCVEIGELMGCVEGMVKVWMFYVWLWLCNLMLVLGGMDELERECL